MIQATDNEALRSSGAQSSATQLMQEALRTAATQRTTQVQPVAQSGSAEVSLSDTSRLLNALQSRDPASHPVVNALSGLMEQLTGQKVAGINIGEQSLEASSFSMDTVEESLRVGNRSGLDYQYRSVHAEGEQLSYSASGSITLEDGTELSFEFKLEMSRLYVEETRGRVQVDGASLRDALGSTTGPGMQVKPRNNGFDVDLDHEGIRRLLEGMDEPGKGHGRHRHVRGHGDDDDRGHSRGGHGRAEHGERERLRPEHAHSGHLRSARMLETSV